MSLSRRKRLRVVRADLDVVDALHIREIGMHTSIRKRAALRDRLVLQVRRSQDLPEDCRSDSSRTDLCEYKAQS